MDSTKKTINPDLLKERQKCTFRVLELTHLLDGGPDKTEDRKQRGKIINILQDHQNN